MLDQNSLLVTLIVGAVAGWLAGLVTRGSGYGIIGDIVVGLLGAFIGSYLVRLFNLTVHLGNPLLDKGAIAFVGAVILLLVVSYLRPMPVHERIAWWWRRR